MRAFRGVGGVPRFIVRGRGAHIWDADENEYVDYVGSWGPLILGHADRGVLKAVRAAAANGTSFGAPTELEIELAEAVRRAMPAIERVRMVSSGTEATMSALRLARAATGRDRVVKFDGCYHGHVDSLLVGAGSGVATLGIPGSPGVPRSFTDSTILTPFNDLDAVAEAMRRWGDQVACVIVEPVAGNMGFVPPVDGFLSGLRKLCDAHGALLIFDEVMTGFRVAHGGAQALFGVKPDLTCLGKVVGGGLPAAAYGGRADLMAQMAPEGPVYQAGTLSGNPLAMAAGVETLRRIAAPGFYDRLAKTTRSLADGLRAAAHEAGVELSTGSAGGMFGFFFHPGPVRDFADAKKSHLARFQTFFRLMLEDGIYLAPSAFEAGFVSAAHRSDDIARTLETARKAFRKASLVH